MLRGTTRKIGGLAMVLVLCATITGLSQSRKDSLLLQWQKVEKGTLALPDSTVTKLLFQIGEAISYNTPDSAIYYYNMALALIQDKGATPVKGNLLNKIGYIHYILGNYDLALTFFMDALGIHQLLNNNLGISISLNHISLIYETQRNFQKALETQWRSIVYSKLSRDQGRLISNYFNLSIIHDDLANYDSAIWYLKKSLDLSNSQKNTHMATMATNRLGEVYLHMGNFQEAEHNYKKVLDNKAYKNNWEDVFAYAGLAKVYQKQGQYDKSIEYGLVSLDLARKMKSKWEIAQDASILYESYKARKDYEKALGMLELFKAYNDSLFDEKKEKEINFLLLRQNELEKDQLAKENALHRAVIKQNYQWIVFFIFLGIVLVVWGIILYRNNRQKQLLNMKLQRNSEKITERNAMIEEQNIALNQLNETKNQLLSVIGHDMRGPINNIKSILEIIKLGGLNEDDQKRVFKDLHQTISSVSDTMNNMLAWASRQLHGIEIRPASVHVSELVDDLVGFFERTATEKYIELIHVRKEDIYVWADIDHLKTALRNIISNAIKFTKRNGKVTISYQLESNFVELSVTDTGVGIAPESMEKIFQFTGRSKSVGTNNEKGTGIGLMLSKEFIESNGGRIEVTSQVGLGTTFTMWLPQAESMEPQLS